MYANQIVRNTADIKRIHSDPCVKTERGDNMTSDEILLALYSDMQEMKMDMQGVKREIQDIRLTIENETNKNIKLLAENHGNLIDKLNQAIKVSDKTAIYEIQVNILTSKVDKLEKELAEIKSKIA